MRQIVTFGGGGFSMEAGNPLLDEFVLELTGRPRPRVCFLPSASGDADHYIVRFYRHFSAARCEPSHLSLFRRERAPAEPRDHLSQPGPDLRRRRERHEPARRLAGPRDRRDPARGLGARDRPLRALGRLAVLVCGGRLDLPRAAAAGAGPRAPPLEQHRPLLERARPPRGAVRVARRRHAARLRRRRRRRAAFHRRRPRSGGRLAPARSRVPGGTPPRSRGDHAARDALSGQTATRCR